MQFCIFKRAWPSENYWEQKHISPTVNSALLLLRDILIYSLLDPLYIRIRSCYFVTLVLASKIEFILQEGLLFEKEEKLMFVMAKIMVAPAR